MEAVVPVRMSPAQVSALLPGLPTMARDRLQLGDDSPASDIPTNRRAVAIGRVLLAADRWVDIGWSAGGQRRVVQVVSGAGIVVVVGRPEQDVLEFLAVNRGRPVGEAVLAILRSLEDEAPPAMVVVSADGFAGRPPAVLGIGTESGLDLFCWDEGPLPAGVVAAMAQAAMPPGPAWTPIGSGTLAELIDRVARAVDEPGARSTGAPDRRSLR